MKAFFLLCALGLATFATAIPSDYEDDLVFRRAVNDKCKAPLGTGSCQHKANCPGVSYPTGLCPRDPDDVQCCYKKACKVPSVGSGYCRSVKNNGCSGGKFYAGHCPGNSDIKCCVKSGGGSSPGSTSCKVPNKGSGKCQSVKNDGCPSGSFYKGFCPGNSDNKCCVKSSGGGTSCSVPNKGSGKCQSVKNDGCPGGSFYTGFCPGNSDNKCCVKSSGGGTSCSVPNKGSGKCQSVKNDGCPSGRFYTGFCPGNSDNKCCVISTAKPPPANPCTVAAYENLLFSDSISTFLAARRAQSPSCFDWVSDGCSCSPDQIGEFDFIPPCERHDFGYRNGKKLGLFPGEKSRVDDNLKRDLYDVCAKFSGLESYKGVECRRIADIYVAAVRKFGKKKRGVVGDGGEVSGVAGTFALEKRDCDLADLFN